MSAPTPTARGTPTGYKMPEGMFAKITFARNANMNIWEKTVKPPKITGGDMIDTTTQFNNRVKTFWPRKLHKYEPVTLGCAYDPDVIGTDFQVLINVPDVITLTYPDGTTEAFNGVLLDADFGDLKEGEFPEVTLTIGVMAQDSSMAEQIPVITPAAGT